MYKIKSGNFDDNLMDVAIDKLILYLRELYDF